MDCPTYSTIMDAQTLRQAIGQRPFQPLILHLVDGRTLDVPHSDFISISQSGRRVIVEKPDDSYEVVDVMLINSLEFKTRLRDAA